MTPSNLDERRQRQPLLKEMPSAAALGFARKRIRMLVKICDFSPYQENEPADIEPDEKDHHYGKAGVDRGVSTRVCDEGGEPGSNELPETTGSNSADQGGTQPHSRVRKQFVDEREGGTQQNKRHDLR